MIGLLGVLLRSKLGHLVLGLLSVVIVAGGMSWHYYRKGWNAAEARYQAEIAAATEANRSNTATIAQLQQANAAFAEAASADVAKTKLAVAQAQAAALANAKARDAAIARLHEIERNHGEARAWAAARVPDVVLCRLRQPADCPH